MKRLFSFLIAAVLSGMLAGLGSTTAYAQDPPEWTANRMIAHGMGAIGDTDYTNSYEAFIVNYARGHRVFETDLLLTTDGRLAARHDWLPYTAEKLKLDLPKEDIGEPLSMKEFKQTKILGNLMPLSFRDIVNLMHKYPDMYLITDTKETDLAIVRKQFEQIKQTAEKIDPSVLKRIIPELYTQEMYHTVMDIYPFPNKLYSLYLSNEPQEETVKFVKENDIQTVAMPVERAQMMPSLVTALNEAGVRTYVHAVNSQEGIDEMEKLGVYGIYTDYLPNDASMFKSTDGKEQAEAVQKAASPAPSGISENTASPVSSLSKDVSTPATAANAKSMPVSTPNSSAHRSLLAGLTLVFIAVVFLAGIWVYKNRKGRRR